jgi:predicted transcriptional regulator
MNEDNLPDLAKKTQNSLILSEFSVPKTPSQVRKKLGIKKFNLKPYLKRGLLKCLNPEGRKGKLYVHTRRTKRLLKIPISVQNTEIDYALMGWIQASPRQRCVVLKTLFHNSAKHTSEAIRIKSAALNPCLSRISTKRILKELINKKLAETEMGKDRKRYYWATDKGKSLSGEFHQLPP